MFIQTSSVVNWQDLHVKVVQLFREMDYIAEMGQILELAGRGRKEIDVVVTDPLASYNRIYLIECKYLGKEVPQEVIHSFKTVMEETGANTDLPLLARTDSNGERFDAARYTNIKLLTFEQLQHQYGDEWFRKKTEKVMFEVERLNTIYRLHFDQSNIVCICNSLFFHSEHLRHRLAYFHRWTANLKLCAMGTSPESYLGPEPIKLPANPVDPLSRSEEWFEIPTVRDYSSMLTGAAKQCADEFDDLFREAHYSFRTAQR